MAEDESGNEGAGDGDVSGVSIRWVSEECSRAVEVEDVVVPVVDVDPVLESLTFACL